MSKYPNTAYIGLLSHQQFWENRKLLCMHLTLQKKGQKVSSIYYPRIVVGLVAFKMYYTNPFSKSYSQLGGLRPQLLASGMTKKCSVTAFGRTFGQRSDSVRTRHSDGRSDTAFGHGVRTRRSDICSECYVMYSKYSQS